MKPVQPQVRTQRMATPASLNADRLIALAFVLAIIAVIVTS